MMNGLRKCIVDLNIMSSIKNGVSSIKMNKKVVHDLRNVTNIERYLTNCRIHIMMCGNDVNIGLENAFFIRDSVENNLRFINKEAVLRGLNE